MTKFVSTFVFCIPFLLLACQNPKDSEFDKSLIKDGQMIAETHCAVCHSTGMVGISPRSGAPALRHVLATYKPSALADDFREHIHVGQENMPDFDFTAIETEALLAYLSSIQKPIN